MVKAHNKSRDELKVMKVTELKALVRTHNLDNAIRRYSSMKKAELVDALVKHSGGEKPAPKPAPKPAAKKAAKKPAAKKRKLEIVEKPNETPAERASRRRVIRGGIPIAKANFFDTEEEAKAFSARQAKFRKERREKYEREQKK